MIIGIGTDLVHIPRMQTLLEKHGDKIAARILSEREFAEFKLQLKPAAYLAKRFAAKEAAAKAMGTGFRDGLSLRHIVVSNNELGKPELSFEETGLTLKDELKIGRSLLSLSDDHEYASAYVILMEAMS
ncbi:Holo-[acyl-carrier protein] synthase [Methylophaga thiooxydans]|uniref:Holo-[acyl-carrier-protein] synthase n=2 Tax=Methylophaga thiooxydans TaxID=392484 RepID=C0N4P7_9GAMM|nr:holo-ACP synthase [Methylophaga thiooxydans]EEF80238.1 holo-(acyl-carrier-protein) synthase [Methylophaga thiooxydans DMS010]KGM06013.1 Holo-[acyl-carrier protein] synthase [Methylophaga thiooxydans]